MEFLSGLNRGRYGVLLNYLHNAFQMGCDAYPKTLTAAYYLAINWKGDTEGPSVAPNDGVVFTAELEEVDADSTDVVKMKMSGKPVVCHMCGKNHYANKCPDREESVTKKNKRRLKTSPRFKVPPKNHRSMLRSGDIVGGDTDYSGLMFCQVTSATIKNLKMEKYQHIISQSEGHISLLNNIRKSNRELAIFSAGGNMNTNLKGDIPVYGTVCFRPGGIKNILSLSKVAEKYRVAYDSTGANRFLVYLPRREVRSFQQFDRGLFYSDMAAGQGALL